MYAGDKWRVYIDARIRQFLDEAEQSLVHCGTIQPNEPKEKLSTLKEMYKTFCLPITFIFSSSCDFDLVDVILAIDTTSSEQKFFEERHFAEDLVKSLPTALFEVVYLIT